MNVEVLKKYAKLVGPVLAAVVSALIAVLTDGVTPAEWIQVSLAAAGAAVVFTAPNVPGAKYTKVILAVIVAILSFFANAILDGVTTQEWLQAGLILLGALGVGGIANTDPVTGENLSEQGSLN